uniref:Uncharacterized protein n=1 Tax=Tetranychus urticae TaxID=32264 RepID=T1JU46_TETUR
MVLQFWVYCLVNQRMIVTTMGNYS